MVVGIGRILILGAIAMAKSAYDYVEASKLEDYIRKHYRNQLSNGALSFYLTALPYLERKGLGLCAPITATYQDLVKAGFRSKSNIKTVLNALNGVLCEVVIGLPIAGESGKEATRIRRYTLKELKNGETARRLIDYRPADARMLAGLLASRSFVYGDDAACSPAFNVLLTGRVQSSRPNVQGDPESVRIRNLCAGLEPGQVLISADYKAAEPTLIQHAMDFRFDVADPYQKAADLLGIDRDSAKQQVNRLAYSSDSVATLWR